MKIAAGNSGDSGLGDPVRTLLSDTSPLVRGAAVWALSRLLAGREFRGLAEPALREEADGNVQDEWRLAMGEAAEREGLPG